MAEQIEINKLVRKGYPKQIASVVVVRCPYCPDKYRTATCICIDKYDYSDQEYSRKPAFDKGTGERRHYLHEVLPRMSSRGGTDPKNANKACQMRKHVLIEHPNERRLIPAWSGVNQKHGFILRTVKQKREASAI
jgi:hypothetical protein